MSKPSDLVQGTLDMLLLKILALEPMNGFGVSQRLKQVSGDVLQMSDGSLYPALHKLEQEGWITAEWMTSAKGRRAKYYSLTRLGRNQAGNPGDGWVWPAPTRSGHLEGSSLKKQPAKAFAGSNVRPFVLYSLRHTFLTRLGESGCDAWTLARIAGHSSVGISTRYVHPSEDAVLNAVERLGGHNFGHSEESLVGVTKVRRLLPS
jgi:PadR family transcriptional regulator PadR